MWRERASRGASSEASLRSSYQPRRAVAATANGKRQSSEERAGKRWCRSYHTPTYKRTFRDASDLIFKLDEIRRQDWSDCIVMRVDPVDWCSIRPVYGLWSLLSATVNPIISEVPSDVFRGCFEKAAKLTLTRSWASARRRRGVCAAASSFEGGRRPWGSSPRLSVSFSVCKFNFYIWNILSTV